MNDPMEAVDVLREFVADVQSAYGNADVIDEDELDWPDLLVTYRNAVQTVAIADRE